MKWFNFFQNKKKPPAERAEKAGRKEVYENPLRDKLLEDRIVFLGTPIDDAAAQKIIAEFLYLEHRSPAADINFYINSPGGSVTASFAIYDTIKSIKPEVATICLGQASGTAALLVASGAKGKRFARPSSRFLINRLKAGDGIHRMSREEVLTYQKELKRMKALLVNSFVEETGRAPKKFLSALRHELILSAPEAIEYGLIDAILENTK